MADDNPADNPLVKEIFIDGSPEEIFPYLTETDKYLQWMGRSVEIDPRPGGVFEINPNGRDVMRGKFLEVEAPRRVVFTWGWTEPGKGVPAGSTTVEIELIPQDGGTLLRLTHRNLPAPSRDRHEMGWSHYLGRLKIVAAGGDPGPDPFADQDCRHG